MRCSFEQLSLLDLALFFGILVSRQSVDINLPGYNNQTALLFALGNPNTPVEVVHMLTVNGAYADVLDAERDSAINYLYDTRTRHNEREFVDKMRVLLEKMDFGKVPLDIRWPLKKISRSIQPR